MTRLLVSVLISLSAFTMYAQKIEINSVEAEKLINKNKSIVVLDVRTAHEFQQGHVKGAVNMDMKQQEVFKDILNLDPNKKYLVYCRTKNRSGVVVNQMVDKGFKNVYHMVDGIIGWNQNILPLEK